MKRVPLNGFLLVLIVALPLAVDAAPNTGVTKDAEIAAIVSGVDPARILNTRRRIAISEPSEDQLISPQALGLNPGDSFFVSVSAVDEQGHESLFAYPEVRCDSTSCAIPSYAFNVTAPLPPPPPAKDAAEDDD